jgi:predicted DNA-binding WGR domain protein
MMAGATQTSQIEQEQEQEQEQKQKQEQEQKQSEFQQAALFQLHSEAEEAELLLLDITRTLPEEPIGGQEASRSIALSVPGSGSVCASVSDQEKAEGQAQGQGNNKKKSSKTSLVPPACIPVPEGYATYAFYRYKPQENSYREYQVSYQPSLWEPHAGQRMWGRRGNKKRLLDQRFETQEEALDWLQKVIQRRLKKGYVLAWYSSTVSP